MVAAVIFDGKNYNLWEWAVWTSLKVNNKLGFIDGTLTKPQSNEDKDFSNSDSWDMANSMLCSWILNVIDPKLRITTAYSDTAREMWEDLKKCYAVANAPKIHQLKSEYSILQARKCRHG